MGGETQERGNWSSKLDFLLSSIGYAVGLGNVWRFPYLAYKHGGASFLIPYVIMLFVAGLPMFFVELALGQFTSEGPLTVWKMAPMFTGIGYGMVIINAVIVVYYNMIIAYAIYYMFVSFVAFDDDVPWSDCNNWWNTDKCRDTAWPRLSDPMYNESRRMSILYDELYTESCVSKKFNVSDYNDFDSTLGTSKMYTTFMADLLKYPSNATNITELGWQTVQGFSGFSACKIAYTSASEEFFERYVLRQQYSPDIGDLGDISVKLIITLGIAWLLVFLCLMNGIKTTGKVVYFTATFPYVILVVLLIRGLTLEGFEDGINFYVIPEWEKLKEAQIWNDAATQIFYSLGIGFGGLLTMSSYNKFNNNCYRDAIMVSLINCGTSIFAGFAVFSLLGHMAYLTNQDVSDVAKSGAGLAFVAYPDGISRLPASSVWAFLFFFMILTLGLDTQFVMMETVISAISDVFPNTLRKYKTTFTFIICTIGFLLGIPQTTQGGIRVLTLMNDYSGSYNLMIIALAEIVCLFYVYGLNNFRDDIKMMIGFRPSVYWIVNWMFITPAAIIFIVIASAIQYEVSGYAKVKFPDWAEALGWLMVCVPIFVMILVGLIQICRYGFSQSLKPQPGWGPARPEDRIGRYALTNSQTNPAFMADDTPLPYLVDAKTGPPPTYNGKNGEAEARL